MNPWRTCRKFICALGASVQASVLNNFQGACLYRVPRGGSGPMFSLPGESSLFRTLAAACTALANLELMMLRAGSLDLPDTLH